VGGGGGFINLRSRVITTLHYSYFLTFTLSWRIQQW